MYDTFSKINKQQQRIHGRKGKIMAKKVIEQRILHIKLMTFLSRYVIL